MGGREVHRLGPRRVSEVITVIVLLSVGAPELATAKPGNGAAKGKPPKAAPATPAPKPQKAVSATASATPAPKPHNATPANAAPATAHPTPAPKPHNATPANAAPAPPTPAPKPHNATPANAAPAAAAPRPQKAVPAAVSSTPAPDPQKAPRPSPTPAPEPQKAAPTPASPTPAPEPATQPQTLTSSSHTPVPTSQRVGSGIAVTPVSTPGTRVSQPSQSTGSQIRVPKLSATRPSTRSVAPATPATTPATRQRAAPRRTNSPRSAVHTATRPHAPLALTVLTHPKLPHLPSKSPFLTGPAASSGGMSAIDAITLLLAGMVILSPLAPLFRRGLAKASAVRSGRQN
jgi:hypothetical protein